MTHYLVVSPDEVRFYDGGGEYGLDPPEYGGCVATVEAPSKRAAIRLAIKHPDMGLWVHQQRGDGANPFTGLKATDMTCPHGLCCCELCATEDSCGCPECDAE